MIHPAPPRAENPEAKLTGMPTAPRIPLTTKVQPVLESLPVYVRGGAILPLAPLTQSTSETPKGPLTLRVFAGPDCHGSAYFDDGESYAFEHGKYLRMELSCAAEADDLHVQIGPHQGSYPAWWKRIHLEVHRENPMQVRLPAAQKEFRQPLEEMRFWSIYRMTAKGRPSSCDKG